MTSNQTSYEFLSYGFKVLMCLLCQYLFVHCLAFDCGLSHTTHIAGIVLVHNGMTWVATMILFIHLLILLLLWVFLTHLTRVYHNLQILIIYQIYSSYEYSFFFFFFFLFFLFSFLIFPMLILSHTIKGEFLRMFLHNLALSSRIFLYVIMSCVYVFSVSHMLWWVMLSVSGNVIPYVNLWQKGGVKIGEMIGDLSNWFCHQIAKKGCL